MNGQIHRLIALLAAAVLAIGAHTMAHGVASAHGNECSVCEFSDDEAEVFP
jgi:hypothetical protein